MNARKKNDLLSKRNIRLAVGFVIVALVAGIYFLFRPFPAGPSLEAVAGVKEAASVKGWSAYANAPISVNSASIVPSSVQEFVLSQQRNFAPPSVNSASSIQRLDIGAGYVLETGSQGTKVIAPSNPSAAVPAVAASTTQRLDIGNGYVLENSSQGSRIVAPSASSVASASVQKLDIGNGYVLENSSRGTKIVAPSAPYIVAPAVAASATQRLDIGNGYVLENSSQGSRIVAPNAPLKIAATASGVDYLKQIDIGSGYKLVMGPGSRGEIVPTP